MILAQELIGSPMFEPLLLMLLFGIIGSVPMLIISRLISPKRRFINPVKFLPMECGQVPSGEGRTHFMMQYYSYVLMFVVFDVMAIFLYAWGTALFGLGQTATLPIMAFLGVLFAAMGYCHNMEGLLERLALKHCSTVQPKSRCNGTMRSGDLRFRIRLQLR